MSDENSGGRWYLLIDGTAGLSKIELEATTRKEAEREAKARWEQLSADGSPRNARLAWLLDLPFVASDPAAHPAVRYAADRSFSYESVKLYVRHTQNVF